MTTTLLHTNRNGNSHISKDPNQLFDQVAIQSNLTQTHINTNPILQSASPIINYVSFICSQEHSHKKSDVEACLCHEIEHFSHQLQSQYRPEVVLAARHVLCAWSHELLKHSPWGKKKRWTIPTASKQMHNTSWEGENFFEIIRRSAQQPTEYKDLLELCYYCMTLGYQGIYRAEHQGYLACYTIIDKLWSLIGHNIDTPNYLSSPNTIVKKTKYIHKVRHGLLALLMLCLIGCGWFEYQRYQNMELVFQVLNMPVMPQTR